MTARTRLGPGGYPVAPSTAAPVTHNQTVSPSTSSTLTAVKQAGKTVSPSTSSTLTAVKQAGKTVAIATSSPAPTITNIGTANISTGVTSVAVGSAISAGALVVVLVSDFTATISSATVTDSEGNTYTQATTLQNQPGVGSAVIFYSFITIALTTSDTITYTEPSAGFGAITVAAATGYTAIDGATTNTNTSVGGFGTWTVSGAGSAAVANEINFCLAVVNGSSITGNGTLLNVASGAAGFMYPAYIVNSGTSAETFTGSCTANQWDAAIVSFQPAVTLEGTVGVLKAASKKAAISTTSALTAVKSIAHKLAISTASALSVARSLISGAPTAYTQTVTIATSSSLAVIKRVSKMIWGFAFRVTQDGFQRVTQDGNQRVVEAAGFSSTSSMTLSKVAAIGRTVAISTTSALSFTKAVTHKVAISATSTVTVVRKLFASVRITITTSSAVTVAKSVTKGASAFVSSILISDGSSLTVIKAVSKKVAIATTSALAALKAVSKRVAITTTESLVVILAAQVKSAIIVAVTTSSVLSLRKAVSKALSIQTSSALAFGKAFGRVVAISSSSTLSLRKAVAKKIAIATASAVQLTLGYIYTVLLTIATATASTVVISWTLARVCLVQISTISSLLLNALHSGLARGREMINLVGRWAHMLLYGQVSQLVLAGQMSHMELGMSTNVNGVFHAGETWIINGLARDEFGTPLNLAGATVQLRIVNESTIVLDLATPANGVVVSPAAGTYQFLITPTMQFGANMTLTAYEYELRVELSNGTISVQNTGEITVKPSRFVS